MENYAEGITSSTVEKCSSPTSALFPLKISFIASKTGQKLSLQSLQAANLVHSPKLQAPASFWHMTAWFVFCFLFFLNAGLDLSFLPALVYTQCKSPQTKRKGGGGLSVSHPGTFPKVLPAPGPSSLVRAQARLLSM